ncbi:2-hydroxyacid dehydrogenase [Paracoccus sp. MA]|uniref:2-hydroxyacid dehydrogenase n=1 Tax=Paracoccus sp. MA TaxID=2895796 RepID=UPI001E45A74C|nr:2-hydroxyacid dehydrogenase [Paracoccus sp. MA]UFM65781.1 2-hydroxyacid dehydrogenase [Paracoccus sp. MA]
MNTVLAVGPYSDSDAAALRDAFAAVQVADLAALRDLPAEERAGIRAMAFCGHEALDGAAMDLLPGLEVIANYGVGYDAIDIDAATARGIVVTNTPDVLNDDVADLAVALLLAEARRIVPAEAWLRAGHWAEGGEFPLARKLTGRRVGILGLGRIGREIAARLAAFKCEIHYFSRQPKQAPGWVWHDSPLALAEAVQDLVVSTVGGEQTRGLVDAQVIAALGPDGVIVNISRGSVIDEEALIAALEQGRLRGAGLDVFRGEPRVDPRLVALGNVVLLPHVGSATVETRAAMGALQRQNLRAVLDGRPAVTPVNRL